MSTTSLKYFDTLKFVKKPKELGASEDLATKYGLKDLELRLIKWMLGISVVTICTLSGVILTVFKLMVH